MMRNNGKINYSFVNNLEDQENLIEEKKRIKFGFH